MPRACFDRNCEPRGRVTALGAGSRLGQTLRSVGALGEAEAVLINAVLAFERTLGAADGNTVTARRALARVYRDQGKRDLAVEQLRLALPLSYN